MAENDLRVLAAIDPSNFGGLPAFYREKIRLLENERTEWISYFGKLQTEQKIKQELQMENLSLKTMVGELEVSLAECQSNLISQQRECEWVRNHAKKLEALLNENGIKFKRLLAFVRPGDKNFVIEKNKKAEIEAKFITSDHFRPVRGQSRGATQSALPGQPTSYNKITGKTVASATVSGGEVTEFETAIKSMKSEFEVVRDTLKNKLKNADKINQELAATLARVEKESLESVKLMYQKQQLHADAEQELQERLEQANQKVKFYVELAAKLEKDFEIRRKYEAKILLEKTGDERAQAERKLAKKSRELDLVKTQFGQLQNAVVKRMEGERNVR